MSATTTRRGALAALAHGAVTAATVSALTATVAKCSPAHAANIDRVAWDRAFANMHRHRAAYEAHQPTYRAAYDGFERDKPTAEDVDLRMISPIISAQWRRDLLHHEDVTQLHADFVKAKGTLWGAADPAAYIAKHKAACDRVLQFRRDVQAAKDRHNYDAVVDRDEVLCDASYEATWALYSLPAPDHAALHWKLEHLFADSVKVDGDGADPWSVSVMQTLMMDVRRLLPQEA